MPWNNQGGGGPQGPWGQGPRPPQPPDVDKVLEMARQRLSGGMPGGGKLWPALATVAGLLWLATGIYVVGPDEEGVVVRFGAYQETTGPGPHFHLPFPIEQVYKPKVTQVQRIEVGYRTRGRAPVDVPAESLMLTGDENIIDIDLSVQFRVNNAKNYLFNVRNPSHDPFQLVRSCAETAIRQVIGRNSIDEALTTGKDRIQQRTMEAMQEILNTYESGLHIVAVQLQQVAAPQEVQHAFKDVASAREDRERAINEAQGYANDIIPRAKGQAAKLLQEAEAYQVSKVARAKGDADRFEALLAEYNKAREVTESRLYIETMEEVLGEANKVLVDPRASNGVLPYLPLTAPGLSGNKGGAQ